MQSRALTEMEESGVGFHGYESRVESFSMLFDFAKNRRLRIAGSCFQRSNLHRWTWYTNSGCARKAIDHVLVGGLIILDHNCMGFRSAEFSGIDHRLLVTTLKICLKFCKKAPPSQVRLDVRRFRDESFAQLYKRKLAESLGRPYYFEDLEKL